MLPLAISALAVIVFFGLATFYTLPSNVLSSRTPNDPIRVAFNLVALENYGFFTKDPQGEFGGVYTQASGGLQSAVITPQNRPTNGFGLSRRQRAQGPEIANLQNNPSVNWQDCTAGTKPTSCLEKATRQRPTALRNTSLLPTICGDAVLTQEEPVLWSYRSLVPYHSRILKTAHVKVRC